MFQSTIIATPLLNLDFTSTQNNPYNKLQELSLKYNALWEQNQQLKKIIEQMEPKTESYKVSRPKNRRTSDNLDKKFKCPYKDCWKQYASDLAVNLHIKNKHNGGTKTVRETMAKKIVLAEEQGNELPRTTLNFPPGYLKDFKKRFFNEE